MRNIETSGNEHGFTLVELIVSMVVLSVALAGVLSVINYTTAHSADPVLRQQALAIAEAYMEEIVLKSYADPDVDNEILRSYFDDVSDYNDLPDNLVRDSSGAELTDLSGYSVSVSVSLPQDYGPIGEKISGKRIEITVIDPAGESLVLAGYRANF